MAKVKKGNRELTIDEHKVDSFISQGYDVLNDDGAVIKKGKPVTLGDYKEECNSLKVENKRLSTELETATADLNTAQAENEELKLKIAELEKAVADLEKSTTVNKKPAK